MKKYSFVLVLTLFILPIFAQTIPSYVPKDGLVGYWPFNGNANDESGNGNHGTVNGATLTADRNGVANSAYSFEGNQWIEVANSKSIQPTDAFTLSAWVLVEPTQPSLNDNYTRIISKNQAEPQNFATYQLITGLNTEYGKTGVCIRTGIGLSGNVQGVYNWTGPYSSNILKTYQHVVGTYNGSELSFFQNGKLINTVKHSGKLFYDDGKLWFGRGLGTTTDSKPIDSFFNGQLDDIAIYNRALSDQEVQALYTGSPCANSIAQVLQPTCFFKTGQIDLKSHTGNDYSYSLDGKNYTADTTFSDLAPGAYTVFVKHTSGCMDSTSVTIQPVPTSLTATTSQVGSVKICAESSMLISAIAGRNYTYQWYKDNTLLQDSISKNLTISKAGKYSVIVSDGACSDTSDYLVLDTIPLPDAPILNTNYIRICDKYNTYLQNIIQMNQINPSYRWYPLETGTDSLSKQSWLPIPYGSGIRMPYYLSQFSATNPACESKKRTMLMLEDKTPPNINYISNTTLCPGDSIELQVNNWVYSCDLEWRREKDWVQTIIPNSQCKTSIFVKEAGNYSVYNKQCMNYINYGPNSIQIDMQTVSIQDFSNYVLKNEAPIPLVGNPVGGVFSGTGVTNSVFDPSALKLGKTRIKYNYVSPSGCAGEALKEVIVVDSSGTGGCTQIKYDTVIVKNNVYDTILKIQFKLTTGVKANQLATMSLYPNPTSDVLIIDLADVAALKEYRYRILDLSGKEVYNAPVTVAKTEISLKSLGAKGMYVLHILDANAISIQSKQIVLE